MVPMNVRQASEQLALGNRISSLFVHLPVAAPRTGGALRARDGGGGGAQAGTQSLGTSTIISLAGLAPPAIHATSHGRSTRRASST